MHCCVTHEARRRYVDALDSVDALDPTAVPPLVCVVESPAGGPRADERVRVSVISVCASTGDVVWDQFDGGVRSLCCGGPA